MPPSLRMPLAVAPGRGLLTLEQDSPEEIAQSIGLLLATTPGDRRSVPAYGLPNALGDGVEPDEIVEVVSEWEQRADPIFVEELADGVVQQLRVRPQVALDVSPPTVTADQDLEEE